MKKILIIFIIFVSSICFAEIYKWVDEKGTTHFTEDPTAIPEKYREKAKSRVTDEDIRNAEKQRSDKENQKYQDGLREKARKRIRFTRKEFEDLMLGKNKEQVIELIGRPSSVSASSDHTSETWYYRGGIAYDPLTGTVSSMVSVHFELWVYDQAWHDSMQKILNVRPSGIIKPVGLYVTHISY